MLIHSHPSLVHPPRAPSYLPAAPTSLLPLQPARSTPTPTQHPQEGEKTAAQHPPPHPHATGQL